MISQGLELSLQNLSMKIGKWEFQGHNSEPIYILEISYHLGQEMKQWKVERDYDEFQILHTILVQKFNETPYLPLKVSSFLRSEEQKERVKLMEQYLQICLRRTQIFNSLEMRLFLDLEQNLNIFLQPLLIVGDFELDDHYPIKCDFWELKKIFFVLTSSSTPEKSSQIKSFISNIFYRPQSQGTLYILKEKLAHVHEYEIKLHQDLQMQPTCMETNEKMEFLAIGFADGSVETYFMNQNLKMSLICKINSAVPITDLKCLSQYAVLIQIQKNLLNYSNIQDGNYTYTVSKFQSPITAFLWAENNDLMFLGEQKGSLHIYQYQKEKNTFQLCITNALRDKEISSLHLSKSNQYLIVVFSEGSIEFYDLGTNFSAKPLFHNSIKF